MFEFGNNLKVKLGWLNGWIEIIHLRSYIYLLSESKYSNLKTLSNYFDIKVFINYINHEAIGRLVTRSSLEQKI